MVKYANIVNEIERSTSGNAWCYAWKLCESGDISYKCTFTLPETKI